MIMKKKMSGQFAKQGEDYKNGDLLVFLDAGTEQEGTYGMQHVFTMKFPNGESKLMTVNQTSINNLIDGGFEEESTTWVGKTVKAEVMKQNVAGKFVMVTYLFAPDVLMDAPETIPFN